jgi:hypothetical protein
MPARGEVVFVIWSYPCQGMSHGNAETWLAGNTHAFHGCCGETSVKAYAGTALRLTEAAAVAETSLTVEARAAAAAWPLALAAPAAEAAASPAHVLVA